ncbi:MAG: hypothetical protein NTW19_00495 [Planctomycetota bacterium]|nr:hypothetical protein [Planctomycetota bacterium]
MKTHLSGSHQRTYDAIFAHPLAHNLHWREVRALLAHLGQVDDEPNGSVKITLGGEILVLHHGHGRTVTTVDVDELMGIRHFLAKGNDMKANDMKADDQNKPAAAVAGAMDLLVVIDHREARVYKTELRGAVPERITPYDPHGFGRHLHFVQDDANGQRKPERRGFYDAVAKTLAGASQILLFGSGTGASSAMEQLLAELGKHHKALAAKVVGSIMVDAGHATEDQLLARAREFHASAATGKEHLLAEAERGGSIAP